jgi:hypothetical protein
VDVNGLFMDDPAFGQRANDTPGYEELVLPWDPRADWSFGTTLRVWFGKAQLYGGAVGQGGKTSAKAAVNTAIGTVTLGHVPDAFAVTDDDLGYGGSRAGFELAVNILNPLSKMGKAGKFASQALSYGGDLNSVAQGAYGVYEDGLDSGDLQNFANALPAPRRPKNSNGGALGVVDDAAGPKEIVVSRTKSPESARLLEESGTVGRPLPVNREGVAARRKAATKELETKPGFDRDEAPPAVLRRDGDPVTVRLVPSSDNRSAGSQIGHQLPPDGEVIIRIGD